MPLPRTRARDQLHDLVVERGGHSDLAALLGDVAVQVLHLGAAPAHDVLEQRRPSARQLLGPLRHVALHVGQHPPLGGVDEALGDDAPDRLYLVASGAADLDGLGGQMDGHAADGRLPDTTNARRLYAITHAEMALVLVIVFVAAFMARGI